MSLINWWQYLEFSSCTVFWILFYSWQLRKRIQKTLQLKNLLALLILWRLYQPTSPFYVKDPKDQSMKLLWNNFIDGSWLYWKCPNYKNGRNLKTLPSNQAFISWNRRWNLKQILAPLWLVKDLTCLFTCDLF